MAFDPSTIQDTYYRNKLHPDASTSLDAEFLPYMQYMPAFMASMQAISNTATGYYGSKTAKAQYQAAAAQARGQAKLSRLNAQNASVSLLYNQARYENAAMQQGLAAAQQMAQTRVSQAGSGVYMNSTSSYEVRASERFAQAVNHANLEVNRVNQLAEDKGAITQHLSNAVGYEGEARANDIMADSINPKQAAWAQVIGGIGQIAGSIAMSQAFSQALPTMGSAGGAGAASTAHAHTANSNGGIGFYRF